MTKVSYTHKSITYIQISMQNLALIIVYGLLSIFISIIFSKLIFTQLDAILYTILVVMPIMAIFVLMNMKDKVILIEGVYNAT